MFSVVSKNAPRLKLGMPRPSGTKSVAMVSLSSVKTYLNATDTPDVNRLGESIAEKSLDFYKNSIYSYPILSKIEMLEGKG